MPCHRVCSYYLIVVSAEGNLRGKMGKRFRSMTVCGGRFGWRKEVVARKERAVSSERLVIYVSHVLQLKKKL